MSIQYDYESRVDELIKGVDATFKNILDVFDKLKVDQKITIL